MGSGMAAVSVRERAHAGIAAVHQPHAPASTAIGSFLSAVSLYSFASVVSLASAGSLLSIGSVGSILSIGSSGSILSIGSTGSMLSIGAAGGILRHWGPWSPPRRALETAGGSTVDSRTSACSSAKTNAPASLEPEPVALALVTGSLFSGHAPREEVEDRERVVEFDRVQGVPELEPTAVQVRAQLPGEAGAECDHGSGSCQRSGRRSVAGDDPLGGSGWARLARTPPAAETGLLPARANFVLHRA